MNQQNQDLDLRGPSRSIQQHLPCWERKAELSLLCSPAAKGTKDERSLTHPVPCNGKATIQLSCGEDSSSRGSCYSPQPSNHLAWRDCQTPAWELRKQQRLRGCISLFLPLEENRSPCPSLPRVKYIPVSLSFLALSPYPKKWPNLYRTHVFSVLGPSGKEALVASRTEPTSTSSRINFPPLSKDETVVGMAIVPHRMSTMVTYFHSKMFAGSFYKPSRFIWLVTIHLSPCQDCILSGAIVCFVLCLLKRRYAWLFSLECC